MADPTSHSGADDASIAQLLETLRQARPHLEELVTVLQGLFANQTAEPDMPTRFCCPSCGYPHNWEQEQNKATRTDESAKTTNQADTVYFDFAEKRVLAGGKEQHIGDGQPARLVELAVRYRIVNIVDTFISFDEWRLTEEEFNPKRRLQTVISKANGLVKPYGLELVRSETVENTYVLKGWNNTCHKSNVGGATVKLKDAFAAMRKKTISRESALTIALEAFKLDPESLPATFFIIECLRRLEKTQVPADLLRSVNQLLRRQEIVYKDAISAIGRSGTLRTANIGGLIRSYDSALRKIGRRRRIARTLPQWAAVCGTEEARIDEILTHVRAIQQQAEGKERTDKSDHLQSLLNSPEIRDAKSAVIAGVKGQCPKRWSGRRSLSTEFDACFVELILQKVDSAKLQNKASLAAYVRMTIPTMLLDQAFQEVCGLSCGQIKAVQRLRRARQTIRWRTGHEPSDEEVAQELKINGRRLHDIEQWGRQLASVSFDQDRDGCSPEEGAFSSY